MVYHDGSWTSLRVYDRCCAVHSISRCTIRACEVYGSDKYRQMSYRCISQDLSWDRPAAKWEGVFMEMLGGGSAVSPGTGYVGPAGTQLKNSIPTPVAAISN